MFLISLLLPMCFKDYKGVFVKEKRESLMTFGGYICITVREELGLQLLLIKISKFLYYFSQHTG